MMHGISGLFYDVGRVGSMTETGFIGWVGLGWVGCLACAVSLCIAVIRPCKFSVKHYMRYVL